MASKRLSLMVKLSKSLSLMAKLTTTEMVTTPMPTPMELMGTIRTPLPTRDQDTDRRMVPPTSTMGMGTMAGMMPIQEATAWDTSKRVVTTMAKLQVDISQTDGISTTSGATGTVILPELTLQRGMDMPSPASTA